MANPLLGIVLLHLMISSSLPSVGTSTRFWDILLNFDLTPVGGCQQDVKQDDEISFAFDAFNSNSFLKLTGLPIVLALNFPIILTVTGATVNGATTDANRKVSVIFTQVGTQEVKATKPAARSNQITVHVFP